MVHRRRAGRLHLLKKHRDKIAFVAGAIIIVATFVAIGRSAKAPAAPIASASNTSASSIVWVGGYAVGPANAIASVAAESARGTKTGCELPPLTADDKAGWKKGGNTKRLTDLANSDAELASEVFQRLLDKKYGVGYAAMSSPEKNAYHVMTLESEVANGGLEQYFDNSSGNCALQALSALREIGFVTETAAFEKALSAFPDGRPSEDRATRFAQMRSLNGPWPDDQTFYKLTRSTIYAAYIRKHLSDFDLPPR